MNPHEYTLFWHMTQALLLVVAYVLPSSIFMILSVLLAPLLPDDVFAGGVCLEEVCLPFLALCT